MPVTVCVGAATNEDVVVLELCVELVLADGAMMMLLPSTVATQ